MPNPPRSTLTWSAIHQRYELHTYGHMERCFSEEDRLAFCAWLDAQISFAFVGQSGRLSLLKEARTRGSGYWYAYRKQGQRTRKGYLGPSSQVTLVCLEELASSLGGEFSSPSLTPVQRRLKHPPSLLSTRLVPPRLPSFLVKRPRLFLDLETVWTHPLTLVSSSAGSGKTTLLSAWMPIRLASGLHA